LTNYSLPANVENLTYIGTGDVTWTATVANEILTGGAGNDTLNDGTLANVALRGGGGNDTYTVTSTATTVSEAANGGTDTVKNDAEHLLPGRQCREPDVHWHRRLHRRRQFLGQHFDRWVGQRHAFRQRRIRPSDWRGWQRHTGGDGGADTFVFGPIAGGFGKDTVADCQREQHKSRLP
jgi:Ca2+-binding RTX toxin-like protein